MSRRHNSHPGIMNDDDKLEKWDKIENQRYVHGRCSRLKTYGQPHPRLAATRISRPRRSGSGATPGKRPKKEDPVSRIS
ncbi:MAG: hypothetical protein WBX25_02015 [Rhodomicrobium sp.]